MTACASPWVIQAALDDEVRDHTSILTTLREAFPQFGAPMHERDSVMRSVGDILGDDIIGGPDRLPEVRERVKPPIIFKLEEEDADEPLDAYQIDLVTAMLEVATDENLSLDVGKSVDQLNIEEALAIARRIAPEVGAEDVEFDAS